MNEWFQSYKVEELLYQFVKRRGNVKKHMLVRHNIKTVTGGGCDAVIGDGGFDRQTSNLPVFNSHLPGMSMGTYLIVDLQCIPSWS